MKLYLKDIENFNTNSPRALLLDYFSKVNPRTHFDKDCKKVQCFGGSGRSFTDLFRMIKTYFPDIKMDEFAYIFIDIMKEEADYPEEIINDPDEYLGYDDHEDEWCCDIWFNENGHKSYFTYIFCPEIKKVVAYPGTFNDEWAEGSYCLNFDLNGYGEHHNRHTNGGRFSFENILKIAREYEKTLNN